MSELVLLILRLVFLVVLWAFVFAIVYALRSDLFGQRVRRLPREAAAFPGSPAQPVAPLPSVPVAPAPPTTRPAPPGSGSRPAPPGSGSAPGPASRLVIVAGAKEGLEIALPTEQLTIGRSADSGLVIRDDYTSTHHARLMLWNDGWVIQDLDSTNGTFLDGKRVTLPTPVPLNTPVTIGTTSFELRR